MENRHWIQGDPACGAPLFRREFSVKESLQKACLEICGLGYFQAYIDGQRLGDGEFAPALTGYSSVLGCKSLYPVWEERSSYRTGYLSFDLLPYLTRGRHVLAVRLGNGWYRQTGRTAEGAFVFGNPMLRFELTLTTDSGEVLKIESDRHTLWKESEILENNLFFGEYHDLRKISPGWNLPGVSTEEWMPAMPVHAPQTILERQTCPPDRIVRTITPRLLAENGDKKLYDCGENITGWVRTECEAAPGKLVRVQHSEELTQEGTALDFSSAGGEEQIQEDCYLCADNRLTVHPRFCWHGFRYFTIEGPGDCRQVDVIHTDLPVISSFRCSDETLNWLYDAYLRTQLDNIHGCIPSDCPHRERLGYTGDGQVTAAAAMMTLDAREMYRKWMRDILDSQGADTGHIPHTAPFLGGGGGPGGWGCAVFVIPMTYWRIYGDDSLLRESYPAICRWLDYMESRSERGLIVREEEGGWCLGEWCTPPGMEAPRIPAAFVNTCFYIQGLQAARTAGDILGDRGDLPEERLEARLALAEQALLDHFFDRATKSFCQGANGADAFALQAGLGTEKTRRNLVEKYEHLPCLDTGIFGTPAVLEQLFSAGRGDLAVRLLTAQKGDASFARMKEQGATTLWETWDGTASHNHPMFGAAVRLLCTEILGIRQRDTGCGFSDYQIRPAVCPQISWAEGYLTTPGGRIGVRWERGENGELKISQYFDKESSLKA